MPTATSHPALDTAKLDLKFFVAEGSPEPEELIPVFHRFIRDQSLEDLMIDVADYSHVPNGPGVLLVAHDAQFGYESFEGMGLLYSRRRETQPANQNDGTPEARLRSMLRAALSACRQLELDGDLEGRLSFDTGRLLFRINDRLAGSDDAATDQAVRPLVQRVLEGLYPGSTVTLSRVEPSDGRYALDVQLTAAPSVSELLERLSA